jgi:hypothetical protein
VTKVKSSFVDVSCKHKTHLKLPRVFGLTVQAFRPRGVVSVAEAAARWHDKTVIQQALDAIRRHILLGVEAYPPNQCLVTQRDKVSALLNGLRVVAGGKQPFFAELYHAAHNIGGRYFVEKALH